MPHLHLETTADVSENADIPDILEAICNAVSHFPGISAERTRVYHTLRSVWQMGDGAKPAFIHLTIFILSGREVEWKKQLASNLITVLQTCFAQTLELGEADATIDIREMDNDVYVRFP